MQNIIGLDISNKTIDCNLRKKGNEIDDLKITNTTQGYETLINWLKQHRIRKASISMEATGIYYEQIAHYLSTQTNYTIYVINPLKIKKYAESQFNKIKNDKLDAKLISDYTNRHQDKLNPYQNPIETDKQLLKLIALKKQLKDGIKQHKNRHHASKDYPAIAQVHQRIINTIEKQLSKIDKQIQTRLKQNQQQHQKLQNIMTITGISKETAPQILMHLETKQFNTVNQFIAYVGLNPQREQSGTSVDKKAQTGKYGHRKLKSAFYYPAIVAYRENAFPGLVNNLRNRGKPTMIIIGAIMRKLAKIAYSVYKTNTPFDPNRHKTS